MRCLGGAVESAVSDLAAWRLGIDGLLDDICGELHRLPKAADREVFMFPQPPVLPLCSRLASMRPPIAVVADRPVGHRVELTTRERDYGSVTTIVPNPANGTFPYPQSYSLIQLSHHPPPHQCHPILVPLLTNSPISLSFQPYPSPSP